MTTTPQEKQKHALIAGGGSGGHVFPGLAVAGELAKRGIAVSWAGAAASMEEKLATRYGLKFFALPARPLVGRGLWGKAQALSALGRAAFAARALIRHQSIDLVLGTGGYASAGAVVGARLAKVPILLLEPNAAAGVANSWLSRVAAEACVAGDGQKGLHCAVRETGVPIRQEFFDVATSLPFGSPLRLLVLGGSQGARQLNSQLPIVLKNLPEKLGAIFVRHQSGEKHLEALRQSYREQGIEPTHGYDHDGPRLQIELRPFIDDMAGAIAESHLVISRAGAITLAELCAAGRPMLLLPLKLAGGHQVDNALRLEEKGAALVLDAAASTATLESELAALLPDRARLTKMAAAARNLGKKDAAAAIADRVVFWAGGGRN